MNIKSLYKRIPVLLALVFTFTACVDFGDINVDPNNPTDAPQGSLLPIAQADFTYVYGGDMARYSCIFTQQFTGTANQHFNYSRYDLFADDVNNTWNTMFANVLPDLNLIINKSDADGSNHFGGVGKIMKALWAGACSDLWGDMPYSNADKGDDGNFKPTYDNQQAIYGNIISLLNSGIADLQGTNGGLTIGGSDYVYGGDAAQWIKLANVLKARYWIHQIAVDNTAAQKALDALNAGGFDSNADDADFNFAAGQGNPLQQFALGRAGDMLTGEFGVNLMKNNNDPRLQILIGQDGNGEYNGSPIDPVNAMASDIGPYYLNPAAPISWASYAEAKFIEAEARVRLNGANDADANTAYRAGIEASMQKLGVAQADIDAYLMGNDLAGDLEANLEQIINEKYVAQFNSSETFTDWRRTGYPDFPHATGGAKSDIPRRFPYPQTEKDFNTANVPNVALTDGVWWDQ